MSLSGKVTYLSMGACSWLFQSIAHTDRETISSVNVIILLFYWREPEAVVPCQQSKKVKKH